MKEMKITPPEGYIIDEEKSTIYNIVFKKKNKLLKSWEEYCKNHIEQGYILFGDSTISEKVLTKIYPQYKCNTFQTKELAEAMSAFHKLIILRKEWIKNWEPTKEGYWTISFDESLEGNFDIYKFKYTRRTFSFPTKEMAEEFLETFKDLFKIAIPVL